MPFLVSLHSNRVFAEAGSGVEYPKLYVTLSGTSTQVDTYANADGTGQQSYPVEGDADGVFPAVYVLTNALLRHRVTDQNDVDLPGFPQDNIAPELASEQDASGVAFAPTDAVPETNVQDAIETVAALFTDQTDLQTRALTPWPTGGTSNAFTITPSPAITDYGSHHFFYLLFDRAPTGAATLNVNGLGTRNLQKYNRSSIPEALADGDIQPGMVVPVAYDGTRFVVSLPGVAVNASAVGRYRRDPDGTLICWRTTTDTTAINTAFQGGFRSAEQTWTFPYAFVASPAIVANVASNAFGVRPWSQSTTAVNYVYLAVASQSSEERSSHIVAIGRWF